MVRIFPTRAPCSGSIPSFEGRCAGTQICSFYAANVLKSLLALRKAESAAGMLGPKVGNLSYGEMRERSMNGTAAVICYERRADTVQMSALLIH